VKNHINYIENWSPSYIIYDRWFENVIFCISENIEVGSHKHWGRVPYKGGVVEILLKIDGCTKTIDWEFN
jgi:hypothetical protein